MYDPGLAARLDDIMSGMLEMEVTRMFGGYGFLMNGHMCLGVWDDRLVIRIGTDGWDAICDQPHVVPMDFTGKVMKGSAMTHPDGMQIKITRQEIGRIVGCSREMVGRVLKTLVDQGLVSVKGKTMVVFGTR